jgi:dipeptide/tripeptide permease
MSFADLANIVGLIGVALVVASYFLLQIGRLRVEDLGYSLTNAIASVLVLTSLAAHWNLSSAVIEGFWLVISLYGCVKWATTKRAARASSE